MNVFRVICSNRNLLNQKFFFDVKKLKYLNECFRVKHTIAKVLEPDESFELGNFESDVNRYLKPKKKNKIYQIILENERRKEEIPVIICKNRKLNHYRNQTYDKFKSIPLASQNWSSHRTVGDYFKIKIHSEDYYSSSRKETMSFEESGLSPDIIEILKSRGLKEMSEIQKLAAPVILSGKNVLLGAETGCGKTLAYLLPMVQQIQNWKMNNSPSFNSPLVLILCPSRELAAQIRENCRWFESIGIKSRKIVGGHVGKKISNPNFNDIDILVSTPGVIVKLVEADVYNLKNVLHVVLDEADCLLDDSFNQLVTSFLNNIKFRSFPSEELRESVQLTMVSATLPTSMRDILDGIIDIDYLEEVTTNKLNNLMPNVTHKFMRTGRASRPSFILEIAKKDVKKKVPSIIFCNHSETCVWLNSFLNDNGIPNVVLYGDMNLKERRERFEDFLKGNVNTLVCTSVGSRGLDTYQVQHVINYEFPSFIADYIHRAGRTGRLSSQKPGTVTNLISGKNEIHLVQKIETSIRKMEPLGNVNPNIARIIKYRNASEMEKKFGLLD